MRKSANLNHSHSAIYKFHEISSICNHFAQFFSCVYSKYHTRFRMLPFQTMLKSRASIVCYTKWKVSNVYRYSCATLWTATAPFDLSWARSISLTLSVTLINKSFFATLQIMKIEEMRLVHLVHDLIMKQFCSLHYACAISKLMCSHIIKNIFVRGVPASHELHYKKKTHEKIKWTWVGDKCRVCLERKRERPQTTI